MKQSGSKQFGGRRTESAQVILNAEANTPSLVYFGEHETLVGRLVGELIEVVPDDGARREEIYRRNVIDQAEPARFPVSRLKACVE